MADLSAFVDFKITLDKSTATPKVTITDIGSYSEEIIPDITARFDILQPDGITISTTGTAADVRFLAGVLQPASKELRLALDGSFQRGLYVITYRLSAPGYLDTEKVKSFYLNFKPPTAEISPSLDVFTPVLKVNDITNYQVAGFTISSTERHWSATLENLGVKEGHDAIFDLSLNGEYYDANYSTKMDAFITYYLNTATWVSVKDKITATKSFATEVPMSLDALLTEINAYETRLGQNCCNVPKEMMDNYVLATSLFQNLLLRGRRDGAKIPLTKTIDNIQRVLNSGVDPVYEISNEVIRPYSFEHFYGNISGQNETPNVFEIIIGTGNNYRISSDKKQLTILNSRGRPALINAKVDSMFMEGLKVPFKPRSESIYAYLNPVTGVITLANGVFSDGVFISINTNLLVESDQPGIYAGPFDTVFTFSGAAVNYAHGFRFELPSLSNKIKFKINKKNVVSGLNGVLRVKRGGVTIGLGDFALDYLGEPFAFEDEFGIEHNSVVVNGTVTI